MLDLFDFRDTCGCLCHSVSVCVGAVLWVFTETQTCSVHDIRQFSLGTLTVSRATVSDISSLSVVTGRTERREEELTTLVAEVVADVELPSPENKELEACFPERSGNSGA